MKQALCREGDRQEVRVEGRIVDILRADGEIVEVQTGNFGKLRSKVVALSAAGYRVTVVYPVATTKYIVQLDAEGGGERSRRKSPKKGGPLSLFDELIHFPDILTFPGLSLHVVLVEMEELRCPDGKGSWRRRFQTILDRRLTGRGDSLVFHDPSDLLSLLPARVASAHPDGFTSAELAASLSCTCDRARRILYCLRHLGLARERGKSGRSILWKIKKPRKAGGKAR